MARKSWVEQMQEGSRRHKSGSTAANRLRFHKKYIEKRAVKAKHLGKLVCYRTGFLYDKDGRISKEQ